MSGPHTSSSATGMPGVHFYPGLDRTRNVALLNITVGNYQATPLYRVLEAMKTELRRFGSGIGQVEMVGLVPQWALLESALHYLQVTGFSADDVVEHRLAQILREALAGALPSDRSRQDGARFVYAPELCQRHAPQGFEVWYFGR